MTTFFPHLYEYGKIINIIKKYESKENDTEIKPRKRCLKDEILNSNPETSLIKYSLNFYQCRQSTDIDFLVYLELKAQKLRESTYNPLKFYNVTLEAIIKARTELSNINKYEKPPEWPLKEEILDDQYATQAIIKARTELSNINKYEKPPEWPLKEEILDDQYATQGEFPTRHWIVVDTILCIEIAKILPFFVKLNISDQQDLLKTTILLNALFTEAYYSFTALYETLIFPDGKMPIKFPNIHKWQIDIFRESDKISDAGKAILKIEFHRYSRLLLNHLQAKYGDAPGAVRYSQILSVMEAMIYYTQKGKEFYVFLGAMRNFPPHPTMALMDQIIVQ
uniref:NR LBD domain-containing protein n=1 Tax=Panagrolaimus sp. ES5 TaxID=591445 RepID=A0AC34FKM8_9BILA